MNFNFDFINNNIINKSIISSLDNIKDILDNDNNSIYYNLLSFEEKRKEIFNDLHLIITMHKKLSSIKKSNINDIIKKYLSNVKIYCNYIFNRDINNIYDLYILSFSFNIYINSIILFFYSIIICNNLSFYSKKFSKYYNLIVDFKKFYNSLQNIFINNFNDCIINPSFSKNLSILFFDNFYKLNINIDTFII